MKCLVLSLLLILSLQLKAVESPRIEMAILLDTSGSMEGLINQARARIWDIVNDLAKTRKHGAVPDLRVALYQYGESGNGENGHIRQILPLTDDLDLLSEKLFALQTSGSTELCGQVIGEAVEKLAWSSGDHYRAIFIAGNEAFTQGTVDYKTTIKAAVTKGIVVNTIHCGAPTEGQSGMWVDAARRGDGESFNIDMNREEVAITAPQDQRLQELNRKLNTTYLGYGAQGDRMRERQAVQDGNAADASSLGVRIASKASALYKNASWDLVDAVDEKTIDLETAKAEDLPDAMREMSVAERKAHVAEKAKERKALQEEIAKLAAERSKYVSAERKRLAAEKGETADDFGSAMREVLETQLEDKGFETAE